VLLLQLAKKNLPLCTTSANNIKKKEAMVMEVMLMMDVVLAMVTKVTCTSKLGEGFFWVGV
jgi:hypothetical protein